MNTYHKVAAMLLNVAQEQFSNHGCNDLDDDISEQIAGWTSEQKKRFIECADKWNNGPMELEEESLHTTVDWIVMAVLAYMLENGLTE